MSILVDSVATHGSGNNGNDTVPPGITGLDWCHLVSDSSALELTTFVTLNVLTIGTIATNIRTPQEASPSVVTYIGLTSAGRAAAIAAGATAGSFQHVVANVFDSTGSSLYEPIL